MINIKFRNVFTGALGQKMMLRLGTSTHGRICILFLKRKPRSEINMTNT